MAAAAKVDNDADSARAGVMVFKEDGARQGSCRLIHAASGCLDIGVSTIDSLKVGVVGGAAAAIGLGWRKDHYFWRCRKLHRSAYIGYASIYSNGELRRGREIGFCYLRPAEAITSQFCWVLL